MELNPLTQIQPAVILAVLAIFAVTLFVLRRVYYLPYIAVMEARERRFETAEDMEAEARRIVQEAEPEAERMLAEAREEADRIMTASREESERYRRETLKAANDDAVATLEAGRKQLASARTSEVSALRQQAVACVDLACGKLLGSAESGASEKAVDKLIARRMH